MELRARLGDLTAIDESSISGVARCMAVGRLSFLFGFQGPSIPVDTACSSGLVATDLACQALCSGECDLALVGAVNVMLSLEWLVAFSRMRALSPDGRCKAFDASANGLVESEGCGVLVLKRLADAQAADDRILAVIRGSAVNHNGRSASLTAPNGKAQQAVIRKALAVAGVPPANISLLEAHGAGTQLGDPIEVDAAGAVLGEGRRPGDRAWLTSVKTNIGNAEAASGMASLIKVILSLQHEEIPPHLHFKTLNPLISFERAPFAIPTTLQPWSRSDQPRLAGVSSFGISGTNAHIVLEEAPERPPRTARPVRPRSLFCLSAQTDEGLRQLAERYRLHLSQPAAGDAAELGDLAFTTNAGRTHHRERLAVTAGSAAELDERLHAFLRGEAGSASRARVSGSSRPRVAFLFSGQGEQPPGMGQALYEKEPVFRRTLDACAQALRGTLDHPLLDAMSGRGVPDGLCLRNDYAQPLLYALECALGDLWKSWGLMPSAVMGHGLGELSAAYAASALSLEDGAKLAAERGRLMGASAAADSPQVAGVLDGFERAAEKVRFSPPSIPLVSTLTGAVLPAFDARYWRRHLSEPALFREGIETLLRRGVQILLEIGPHSTLSELASTLVSPERASAVASLRRGGDDWESLLGAAGELYARGLELDFRGMDRPFQARSAPAPTYPFQRQRHWLRARPADAAPARAIPEGSHPLLHRAMRTARGEVYLEGELAGEQERPLLEHRLRGAPLLSSAATFDLLLSAAGAVAGDGPWALSGVVLDKAISLGNGVRLQLSVGAESGGARRVELHACPTGDLPDTARWWKAASGELRRASLPRSEARLEEVGEHAWPLDAGACYRSLSEGGWDHGPSFRLLERVRIDGHRAVAEVRGAPAVPGWGFPPQVADACFQALWVLQRQLLSGDPNGGQAYVLAGAEQVVLVPGAQGKLRCEASWRGFPGGPEAVGDLRALDSSGRVVLEVKGLTVKRAGDAKQRSPEGLLYALKWVPQAHVPASSPEQLRGTWVLLADPGGVAEAVRGRLRTAGARGVLVVRSGSAPGALRQQPDRFEVSGPQDVGQVLQALAREGAPARGLVHLWPLDGAGGPEGAEQLSTDLVALVKAIMGAGLVVPPRLYLATRGAQPVGDGPAEGAVAQGALWGAASVLALEHPELWGSCVDLGPHERGEQAAGALEAALVSTSEDLQAWRRGERHGLRLVTLDVDARAPQLRPDGTYLITGGLGALGLRVARWLADQGARHLVLVGRSAARDGSATALGALRAAGVEVQVVQADVTREDELAAALAPVLRGPHPLRGVVHAAAVQADASILRQTDESVRAVIGPKVRGAWNLHRLTAGLPLDFFVLFSSASGVMGQHGQVASAAASAVLDALAHHRRAAGLPANSIDWGPWADQAGGERAVNPSGWGVSGLDPENGLQALGALIARGPPQAVAMQVDWATCAERFARGRAPLYLALAPAGQKPVEETGATALRARLQKLPLRERLRALQHELRGLIARALNLPELETVSTARPLVEAGVNSLRAIQARNALGEYFERGFPSNLLFDYPTVDALSRHLAKEEPGLRNLIEEVEEVEASPELPAPAESPESPEGLLARLARMSDEEAESLAASLAAKNRR
jgi:acyl transferase domain-containing protein